MIAGDKSVLYVKMNLDEIQGLWLLMYERLPDNLKQTIFTP
jgi:hypothetical protein